MDQWWRTAENSTHFADYSTNKLLRLIGIWAMAAPRTPAHSLCTLLLTILADRAHSEGTVTATSRQQQQQQQSRSAVFPFSSYLWDQFPLTKLLDDPDRRNLLPNGSQLRERVFAVRLRCTPLKLQVCNHSAIPKELATVQGLDSEPADCEPVCICTQQPFASFKDAHHGHVLTADMHVLQHLPDLYDMLSRGTSFRGEFLQEGDTTHSILSSFLILSSMTAAVRMACQLQHI